jgi:YjbE family integral membrane protein
MMGFDQPIFWLALLQIIWVNVLLSGDNAVVIALACRQLPLRTRNWGIALGSAVAVVLRILFTGIVATLLALPWLKFAGGLALLYIAVDLVNSDDGDDRAKVKAHDSLWRAVGTVAVADIVMSLDNVVAIAVVARGNWTLLSIGLAISIPLIVVGAALITLIFERWPIVVWAGAGLLGWLAGDLMISDPAIVERIGEAAADHYDLGAAAAGAAIVIALGYLRSKMQERATRPAAKPKRIAKTRQVTTARRPHARAKARRS